ncbi:MAG: septal ring lytic transglycosylase RlpA family protein [Pseudomonadota bacterium]
MRRPLNNSSTSGPARVAAALAILTLGACAGPKPTPIPPPAPGAPAVEPTPRFEPLSEYGNHSPYRVLGKTYRVLASANNYKERGIASWYGPNFHGKPTSNQETFDMYAFTAAHRTLPRPSYARVTRLDNGASVVVRINDRGPFKSGRIIDLSYAAAKKLDMIREGTTRVEVEAIHPENGDGRPEVATANHIFLQLGAFASRDNALKLLNRLRRREVAQAQLQSTQDSGGQPLHRVRVGPLTDEAAAESLAGRLAGWGFGQARLIFE